MQISTIRKVTIQGEGQQSLDSLAGSLDKVKAAQDRNTASAQISATVTDVTTRRQLAVAEAYRRQTLALDEQARAQDKLMRGINLANQAYNQGLFGVTNSVKAQTELAQRVADLTTKYGAATAAAEKFNAIQEQINAKTGVTAQQSVTAESRFGRMEDLEAYAAGLDAVRAKFDPLFAASKQYEATLEEIALARRQGAIDENIEAAAMERTRLAFEKQSTGITQGAKNSSGSLANLSFQINDIATGLASGQSPFMVMAQQGGQVFQIWQMNRTIFSDLKNFLSSALTPARLLAGGLLAAGAAIAYMGVQAISTEKQLEAALTGTGRAAGVTAGQLDAMAQRAAAGANVGVAAARSWAEAYASSGKISGSAIEQLTALTADYAATTRQDVDAANKELVSSFSNLSTGINTLGDKLGAISPAQRNYIKNLEESGQHNKAVQEAIDAMKGSLTDHEQHLTWIGRLWNDIKNAASGAIAAQQTASSPTTDDLLKQARAKLAIAQGNGGSYYEEGGLVTAAAQQQQVNNLTYKARMEREAAARNAAAQESRNLAEKAMPVLDQGQSGYADLEALRRKRDTMVNLMGDPVALAQTGRSLAEVTAEQEKYTSAIQSYITPAERAAAQTKIANNQLLAKTPAQKAAVAAQQADLSLAGQAVTAEERKATVAAAYTQALNEATHAQVIQTSTQTLATEGAVKLAGAWLDGSNAASKVAADTQAQTEALTQNTDANKRSTEIQMQAAAGQVATAAQSVGVLERQTSAQKEANDAVAAGTISYTQAATAAARSAEIKELENLKTSDAVKENLKLVASIDAVIGRKKAANDNADLEHDRALYAQITTEMADQVRLAGMSADEREREAAVLDLVRNSVGKVSDEQKDTLRGQIALRQETEKYRQLVDGISGSFQDFFTDVLDTGKASFGNLWDAIKHQFNSMLASMAAQALIQPIIIPMVQEIYGGGGGLNELLGLGGSSGALWGQTPNGLGQYMSGGGGLTGGALQALSGAGNISSLLGGPSLFGGAGGLMSGIGGALGFATTAPITAALPAFTAGGITVAPGVLNTGIMGTQAGSLFGMTSLGSFLGGAGLGSLASSLVFGNKNDAGIGGMGGAAAGAAIGSIIPGVGTIIGGLIGGLAGGGLGSMTGSSNQGAISNFTNNGLGNTLFKAGGGQNSELATSAASSVNQIVKQLMDAGVSVAMGNISGLSIGSDKSYVYGFDGMKEKLAGGQAGVEAVVKSILDKILPSATGTDDVTQGIVDKYKAAGGITSANITDLANEIQQAKQAKDQADKAAADFKAQVDAFGPAIDAALKAITDPVGAQLDQLLASQKARADQATQYGYDISRLTALNDAELNKFLTGLGADQLQGLSGSLTGNPIYAAAQAAADAARAQADAAASLKLSFGSLEDSVVDLANQTADAANEAGRTAVAWGTAHDNITKAQKDLLISDKALSPTELYNNTRAQFDSLRNSALGGNVDAASDTAAFVSQFLQTSLQYNGATEAYQADRSYADSTLSQLSTFSDAQRSFAQRQADSLEAAVENLKAIKGSIDAGNDNTAEQLTSLRNEVSDLKEEIKDANLRAQHG